MIMIRKIHEDECEEVSALLSIANWKIDAYGLANNINSKCNHTLVLITEHGISGTLSIHDSCRLCNIIVKPRFRGMGYGYLLMEAAKGYIRGTPYLYVKMLNWKAIKLYLMEGYRIVGRRKYSWKMQLEEQ